MIAQFAANDDGFRKDMRWIPLNRSESKYFATADRMDEVFLELLEEKDFSYITIKEICERAGVNRSTYIMEHRRVFRTTLEHASTLRMTDAYADPEPFPRAPGGSGVHDVLLYQRHHCRHQRMAEEGLRGQHRAHYFHHTDVRQAITKMSGK